MGDRRTDAAHLKERKRAWPLAIRLARADDEQAVLGFATSTWDGWDYIPHAWPVWLAATDGVMLVAAPGAASGSGGGGAGGGGAGGGGADPGGGGAALSREGQPLEIGRPIAVSRVAMVSPSEAWLEGIRVDPRVRGMDIATDMQVAELHWAAAQGATVVRYATSARNEASHRLGARHGFELLFAYRGYFWSDDPDNEPREPSAFDPAVRAAATAERQGLLTGLAADGVIAAPGDGARLWPRLSTDPTFNAARRLYEPRPWAMGELTQAAFKQHVARGEVIVAGRAGDADGDWALAILLREQLPGEDSSLRLALLAGDAGPAIELVERARAVAGRTLRFRVPEESPLRTAGHDQLLAAGYSSPEWTLHLLGRPIDGAHPIPALDPLAVVLADSPRAFPEAGPRRLPR